MKLRKMFGCARLQRRIPALCAIFTHCSYANGGQMNGRMTLLKSSGLKPHFLG
jgi:hypothetical protein